MNDNNKLQGHPVVELAFRFASSPVAPSSYLRRALSDFVRSLNACGRLDDFIYGKLIEYFYKDFLTVWLEGRILINIDDFQRRAIEAVGLVSHLNLSNSAEQKFGIECRMISLVHSLETAKDISLISQVELDFYQDWFGSCMIDAFAKK